MGLLPTQKSTIKTSNPRNLIIFGLPKVGKTTALAQLPKSLIIDLENGTDYVESMHVKAKNFTELFAIAKELKANPGQFDFVILDTVTALEDMVLPLANQLYRATSFGKNWDEKESVLKVPMGGGYLYQREAFEKVIGWFQEACVNVILVGHVKDKSLDENGTELNVKDLDLTGKIPRVLSAKSDAICYVYRDLETHNLMANFGDLSSVLCGSRIPHLSGKTILLAQKQENGEIKTFWENIYPSLKK